MPDQKNPMALTALLVSLVPFLSTLAMLGLKTGIGPRAVLYQIAQVSGFVAFGLIVMGTGLSVVALARSERRDWRILTAFALQALSIAGTIAFSVQG